MVPLDLANVAPHTAAMSILVILGAVAILLGILGLAGVIATSVGVEIALFVVGAVLILFASRGNLRL